MLFSLISTFILFPLLLLTWYSVLKSMRKYFDDRKQAEESMYKYERRYRYLVENLNDVIFTLNIEGIITYISPQVYNLYGYKPEELIDQPFTKIIYEEDVSQIYRNFLRTIESTPGTSEFRYISKNGDLRWAQTRGFPILKDGKANGINGIFADITERKMAEEALRESEGKLRAMFESSRDAIGVSKKGIHIFSNHAYNKLFGFADNEQIMGHTILDSIAPSDRERIIQYTLRRASGEEAPKFYEARCLRTDGAEFDAEFSISTYELNNEIYSLATIRDITERKQAQLKVAESEKRFKTIIDQSPIGIALLDNKGHPVLANATLLRMVGYSSDELSRMTFAEFTFPEDVEKDKSQFEALLEGKIPEYSMEKRYIHKNGSLIWANLYVTLRRDINGQPEEIIGMAEDITERKKAQDALAESEAFLNSIIDSTEDLIWAVDSEQFRLLTFNKGVKVFFRQIGIEPVKGMIMDEMLPESVSNFILNLYTQTLKEGFASKIYSSDRLNRILWLNLHLLSKENKPYAISVFGKDITEIKEAENKIKNQLEELRRWNEATTSREDRILELKWQVNELLEQAGKPPIYET
jgi:PAS domain S-box-containing protein